MKIAILEMKSCSNCNYFTHNFIKDKCFIFCKKCNKKARGFTIITDSDLFPNLQDHQIAGVVDNKVWMPEKEIPSFCPLDCIGKNETDHEHIKKEILERLKDENSNP